MAKRQTSNQPTQTQPSRKRQGRPPTARSERTRLEVLNAAAECISREGFAAASTIRIAEQAGVSWGVLQYHFGDKEGLMAAVLEYGMEQTEARFNCLIATGLEAGTLEQRLRIVIHEAWEIYASPLARAATEVVINNRYQWRNDPAKDRYLLQLNKKQTQLARQAMTYAVGDKEMAKFLSGIFLATLHGLESSLLQYGPGHAFSRELEALVQVLASYCEHKPQ